MDPITLKYDGGCYLWPKDVPFPYADFDSNQERRFDIESERGGWRRTIALNAWAIKTDWTGEGATARQTRTRLYGQRRMLYPRESGYQMEGRVSVEGKRRSAWTSSILISHAGKLYTAAVFSVR